jgi:hypothetical protein
MNNYTKQLQQELEFSSAMPYFEISVTRDGEPDWIECRVFFKGNSLVAQREAVSSKEENSKYLASDRIVVNSALTLDEHLQELHEEVINSIVGGNLYTLAQ